MATTNQPRGDNTHKKRRPLGDPVEAPKPHHRFIPIPDKFRKPDDLTLKLEDVLSKPAMDKIKQQGRLCLQMIGDSGGINGTETQEAISYQMEKQIQNAWDKTQMPDRYRSPSALFRQFRSRRLSTHTRGIRRCGQGCKPGTGRRLFRTCIQLPTLYQKNFDGSRPPASPDDEFKFDWTSNQAIGLI